MGHHTAPPIKYGAGYWDEYLARDRTPMGEALTHARLQLVNRHAAETTCIDVGIGGGLFVERSGAHGYDVNPEAVQWLKRRGSYRHPKSAEPQTLTFWDSLEHIPDPASMVQCAKQWVAVSMPIYESAEAVLSSPHYKPGEHLWYWTHEGLIQWFCRRGFECREHNTMETILGRRGIHSYMFERVGE